MVIGTSSEKETAESTSNDLIISKYSSKARSRLPSVVIKPTVLSVAFGTLEKEGIKQYWEVVDIADLKMNIIVLERGERFDASSGLLNHLYKLAAISKHNIRIQTHLQQ